MITKLITEETKDEANPDTSFSVYVAPPVSTFRIGLIKLSVSDVTIPEKAPPMITPIAMSMTFPRNDLIKEYVLPVRHIFLMFPQLPECHRTGCSHIQ